ncbi:hypothetical protein COLO4_16010 [Corchorus olitorius]|uniref:Uncharacterized protein n=1 Tax=Corchorus olitorius TaxID=93759 RepID=A0A1R3JKG0_9ROSI|nr:hypothetical protein COLO4_16010 [Corchorus olitorius]
MAHFKFHSGKSRCTGTFTRFDQSNRPSSRESSNRSHRLLDRISICHV